MTECIIVHLHVWESDIKTKEKEIDMEKEGERHTQALFHSFTVSP